MNNETDLRLETYLAAHLDALWSAPEAAKALRLQAADPQARDLMLLAERLHTTLIPVVPSDAFIERLRGEFMMQAPPTLRQRWRQLPPRYQTAAKVGGATLTAGLMLFAVRRAWTGQRARHRTATAEATMHLSSAS